MKKHKLIFIIAIFLIPIFSVLLFISFHSNLLIKKWMQIPLIILVILLIGFVIYSFIKKKISFKTKARNILIILFSLCFLGCSSLVFLLYGPYIGFREWLVTTAMGTMNHQYLCQWFYNDSEIQKVFDNNYTQETGESTDPTLINPDKDKTTYANSYEEELFKDKKKDELYRIIKFKVNGCDAYLAAVYDPSRVSVNVSNNFPETGQYVTKTAELNKALLAINGGGFQDENHNSLGGIPMGVSISNKKIYTGTNTKSSIIGLTEDNKLVLLKNKTAEEALEMGVRDAVTHSPFLIVNGTSSYFKGTGGWGYAARTAIGQRQDGTILFLVVDSNATRTKGASMHDLAIIMQNYGAYNAANLDGGTSSVMVENYKLINDPIDSTLSHKTRPIATAFLVK